MNSSNLYVFTGGPGSGKSAIIEALANLDYLTVEETGRDIIQEQVEIGGDALPWENKEKFRDLMLSRAIYKYKLIKKGEHSLFLDRGIPGIIGYSLLENISIPDSLVSAAKLYRYNQKVFVTPPWEEIYTTDEERKQSFAVAVATYNVLCEVYPQYGYQLIEVPVGTVEERVQFVLNKIDD